MIEDWLSVPEAAAIIKCSKGRVHQLIADGRLQIMRFNARALAVHKDSAVAYAKSDRSPGRPRKKPSKKRKPLK